MLCTIVKHDYQADFRELGFIIQNLSFITNVFVFLASEIKNNFWKKGLNIVELSTVLFLFLPIVTLTSNYIYTGAWQFHLLTCINAQPNKNSYLKKKSLWCKGCTLKISFVPLGSLGAWLVGGVLEEGLCIPLHSQVMESVVCQKVFWPDYWNFTVLFKMKLSHSRIRPFPMLELFGEMCLL